MSGNKNMLQKAFNAGETRNYSTFDEWYKQGKKRTLTQNAALHLYWTQIANELNNQGQTREFCSFEIPYNMEYLKSLWKGLQFQLYEIESTTQINTYQINELIDVFSLHFGQLGIYIEFPNWQTFLNKLDKEAYPN